MKKIKALVPHVEDWNIKVEAKGEISNGEFIGGYKYKGMAYGIRISVEHIQIIS